MTVKKFRPTINHFYNYAQKIIVLLFKLVLGCFHYVPIETSARKLKIISYYENHYNLKHFNRDALNKRNAECRDKEKEHC